MRAKNRKRQSRRAELAAYLVGDNENGQPVLYVEFDGHYIAKRYPGGSWITLDPRYRVSGAEPGNSGSVTITEAAPDQVH